jgi:excisionase family DNA binding protein
MLGYPQGLDEAAETEVAVIETRSQDDRLLLRIPEVAERLALGRSTIYRLINEGALPIIKIGVAVRVPALAVEEWVSHQTSDSVDATCRDHGVG